MRKICGTSYSSEAHRTWEQTILGARCPRCHRLVIAAPGKAKTFVNEAASSPRSA
jgi:hypothetical protein